MKKEDLKIVFFGTPEFAVASLDKLVCGGYNVAAVVTMPDKQAGRGHHIIQSDVKKYALEKGLQILQPEKLKDDEFVGRLKSINADLFIVIAFRMLPEVVWGMPRLGTFNLHASLLPKYRGAAPINWAVINGEKETGVTTFFLKHEIDTGDIIQQKKIEISKTDNVGVIHDKLMHLGAGMVIETVDDIIRGDIHTTTQDSLIGNDVKLMPAPKIFKDTCHINWSDKSESIYNLIRGLSPYPAAWSNFEKGGKEQSIKIFSTSAPLYCDSPYPGKVSIEGNKIFVDSADGRLEILELQLSGKKRMDSEAFLRGSNLDGVYLK